jgi:hypothetical protein
MSWIERELKRRAEAASADSQSRAAHLSMPDPDAAMNELWTRFEAANAALPAALRLTEEAGESSSMPEPQIRIWLRAPNGAGLGYTGDAIRYLWPESNPTRSLNFWIRWHPGRGCPIVTQRISNSTPPAIAAWRFDPRRVEFVIRQLVQGKRVNARGLRKKRLGLF